MPAPSPVATWRWSVVWLLFLATMLNYMDRQALNNTQRHLLAEFEPDPARRNAVYADIQFAFGVSFALFQIVAGLLIDRFSLRWLYLGAIVVWSGAGVLTGMVPAGAVGALIACRVMLGVGEAFNWPCAVACVRRVIPRESRGLANGIFHSGASIGAVATPFLVLLAVNRETGEGWRGLFVVVGAVGAVWAALWMATTRGDRAAVIDHVEPADPAVPGSSTPFTAAFGMRAFWVCLATGVCVNLCWHFYNQWFPRYLTEDLRVAADTELYILAGFYVAADLGSLVSGWTTRRLVRAGHTVERSRQLVMTGVAVVLLAATVPAALLPAGALFGLKVGMFFVVAAAAMGGFAIFFSLAQDVIPRHTATILGVCGCMSWLVISGVTKTIGEFGLAGPGKYATLFVVIGCVPLLAAAAGWLWPRDTLQH
ncbi:MFS transporter [Urbifossiella limnaea]|uniref:D-galactonate transporter n=1 Tax=Urbifossiella limnaea TaxID=2528023 RepID=A0A517XMY5_9BACT|nr:MFS transporter [Urbifossiella limnaea]QDU18868.1 D-galactonate transporter [Urbifossiella limnaea]